MHDRVDWPEPPAMLVEERVQDRCVELVVTASATVAAKPFNGATLMVEVPMMAAFTVTPDGLALILKSWTTKSTVTELDSDPLVPVILT